MAQIKIKLVCEDCGKEFTHIHNCWNRDDAKKYEEWAVENITTCPSCYGAQQRAAERSELDKLTEEARATVSSAGIELPALTGTEKQIAWAEDIRIRGAAMFVKAKAQQKAWDLFNSKTDAKWWIDNRDYCDPRASVRSLLRAMI